MSTWIEGKTYDYYGTPIVCVGRYFDGPLEMVDLQSAAPRAKTADRFEIEHETFTRAARTLAPCVRPPVTETLGGVCRSDACHHDWYTRVTANAGPHTGKICCAGCGTPPEAA